MQSFKIALGTDVRRVSLPSGSSFSDLQHLVHTSFLLPKQSFHLQYTDPEDSRDTITLSNDADLAEATRLFQERALRVEVRPISEPENKRYPLRSPPPQAAPSAPPQSRDVDGQPLPQAPPAPPAPSAPSAPSAPPPPLRACSVCHFPIPPGCVYFQCTVCPATHLCESCEKRDAHPVSHPLVKIRNTSSMNNPDQSSPPSNQSFPLPSSCPFRPCLIPRLCLFAAMMFFAPVLFCALKCSLWVAAGLVFCTFCGMKIIFGLLLTLVGCFCKGMLCLAVPMMLYKGIFGRRRHGSCRSWEHPHPCHSWGNRRYRRHHAWGGMCF